MPSDEDERRGPRRLPPDPYYDGWWYLTLRTTTPEPEECDASDDDPET